MCDHGVYCEHCTDYYGEKMMISKRSEHYRIKCKNMREELTNQQKTIVKLRQRCDEDADYVNKLKALNQHVTTKCAVMQRDNEQLFQAFEHVKRVCVSLEQQCQIFAEIYARATNDDEETREKLLGIMKDLNVKPALLLK
jgi:predicted RNase H-like nuclease (RuvC/YqgF family)